MSEAAERYCVVVYTDGDKFISPIQFGRIKGIANLPKAKFNIKDPDDNRMQAVLALFNQTGIRVEPKDLESLGIFSSDENFEMDVFYVKVEALPIISNLKCNEFFTTVQSEKRINAMEGYQLISFNNLDNYSYSLKGMKNVLYQIDQHFEKEVPWADIA